MARLLMIAVLVAGLSGVLLSMATAAPVAGCHGGGGVAVDGTLGSAWLPDVEGAWCEIRFDPTPGTSATHVILPRQTNYPTSSPDFDLYVSRGSMPSQTAFECRPFMASWAPEECVLSNDGRSVYIMVRRWSGGGYFDVGTYSSSCSPTDEPMLLAPGGSVEGKAGVGRGSICRYVVRPDPGAEELTITVADPTRRLTVYPKIGTTPDWISDVAERCGFGEWKSCTLDPDGRDVHLLVRRTWFQGETPFIEAPFSLDTREVIPRAIANGEIVEGNRSTDQDHFKILVPEGASRLAVEVIGDPGRCVFICLAPGPETNLFVKHGSVATRDAHCWSNGGGARESCLFESHAPGEVGSDGVEVVPFRGPGWYYIRVSDGGGPGTGDQWRLVARFS